MALARMDQGCKVRAIFFGCPIFRECVSSHSFFIYTQSRVGGILGALAGAVFGLMYGAKDGQEIVSRLKEGGVVSRGWRDPTPGRSLISLAAVLGVCVMPVLISAGVLSPEPAQTGMVGLVSFFGWLLAIEAAVRTKVFHVFERESGVQIKARPRLAGFDYRAE
jgi:hypothetical protein